uniref:Uncharacterized protein n=1 Tax=Rhizophora mucronata TaxID=61149 RepID=A0A2P2NF37_RHIMU
MPLYFYILILLLTTEFSVSHERRIRFGTEYIPTNQEKDFTHFKHLFTNVRTHYICNFHHIKDNTRY